MKEAPQRVVRFGVHELDLRAAELRKHGLKLKLQQKPFQVLTKLLERPGELVTRDELRQALWPADTFVDFDNSLNAAVNKLREVLGDSADSPHVIETLPRRGYRFIAPVSTAAPPADLKGLERDTTSGRSVADDLAGPIEDGVVKPPRRRAVVIGLAALVTALAIAYLFRPTLPPPQILGSMQITKDGLPKESMVTDGARLYFTAIVLGPNQLYQISTAGGSAAPVDTSVETNHLVGISSDLSQLLVLGSGNLKAGFPIYSVPVLGGPPHLFNGLAGTDVAWSPDGRVVFNCRLNGLYMANADGSAPRKLATVVGFPFWPRWSPDGTEIRFSLAGDQAGGTSIWEISAEGKGLHQILPGWNNPPSERFGMWTPDGKYYFFESGKGGTKNIWAIREGGSAFYKVNHQPVQVTAGPASTGFPLPSLGGKKLFVISRVDRGKLVRFDARRGEFVPYLGGISAAMVDFSRDGQQIAYVQDSTLWRSKIDGSGKMQLTSMGALMPRWSPDGAQIAFIGIMPDHGWQVYLVAADGTGTPQQIPSVPGEAGATDPSWSPDGKTLLFAGTPPSLSQKSNSYAVHVMDLRTRKMTTLPGSEGLFSTRWSPNGRYIAALTNGPGPLMVYDLRTGKWSNLGGTPSCCDYEQWSRDSQAIYFEGSLKNKQGAIFRMRLSDHRIEQVVSLEHFHQAPGLVGNWMGIAPDNSVMLVEDVGAEDIYALDLKLP